MEPPLQGSHFGRYRILERLALGASAEVFRAALLLPDGASQLVVLKRILPQHSRDAQVQKLFREEAALLASLSHPNVVRLIDSGELGGSLFLALEHVDGADLQVLLERARDEGARLPVELATHVAVELCSALDYIHTRVGRGGVPLNIVHRDVSPHNLLCSRGGEVKLADFGIARLSTREATTDGAIRGKLRHMAPEQATPGASIDLRADLFATGTVLYELLFERPAFDGANEADLLERFRRCEVRFDPGSLSPEHQPLLRIVQRCLRPRPRDRFPSARALREELVGFLESIGASGQEELRRALAAWVSARLSAVAAPPTEERLAQELLGLHQEETALIPLREPPLAPSTVTSPVQREVLTDEGQTIEQRTAPHRRPDSTPAATADLPPGTVLGGTYRLLEVIRAGGMGVVFEAQHTRIANLRCAVKILRWSDSVTGERYTRFRREAEIIAGLKHPSVVRVIDFNRTDQGLPYLVMDLLEGEDLEARLQRSTRLSVPDLVKMLSEIGGALALAHARGVVHRDLKPSNIFLAREGGGSVTYKLLDFGISRQEATGKPRLTGVLTILGTAAYMSPEQARGELLVDNRSDIFSLATIAYRCLTGRYPFSGKSSMEVREAVCAQEPAPLSSLLASAPPALERVLSRAHAKRREDRYAGIDPFVRELVDALSPFLSGTGPRAAMPEAPSPAEAHPDDLTLPPLTDGGAGPAQRRSRQRALIGLVVLIFLAGTAGGLVWKLAAVEEPRASTAAPSSADQRPRPAPQAEPLVDAAAAARAASEPEAGRARDGGVEPASAVRPVRSKRPRAEADRKVRREKKEKGAKKPFLRYDEI